MPTECSNFIQVYVYLRTPKLDKSRDKFTLFWVISGIMSKHISILIPLYPFISFHCINIELIEKGMKPTTPSDMSIKITCNFFIRSNANTKNEENVPPAYVYWNCKKKSEILSPAVPHRNTHSSVYNVLLDSADAIGPSKLISSKSSFRMHPLSKNLAFDGANRGRSAPEIIEGIAILSVRTFLSLSRSFLYNMRVWCAPKLARWGQEAGSWCLPHVLKLARTSA